MFCFKDSENSVDAVSSILKFTILIHPTAVTYSSAVAIIKELCTIVDDAKLERLYETYFHIFNKAKFLLYFLYT